MKKPHTKARGILFAAAGMFLIPGSVSEVSAAERKDEQPFIQASGLAQQNFYISNMIKLLRLRSKSECKTAALRFLLQQLILQPIHWQRFRERSSVYGIIYQALYSPGSAVAELVRKKLAWK